MNRKRKLRKKIADRLSNKMVYLNSCPNERDIILNIVLSKKDRYAWVSHCTKDCWHKDCESYSVKSDESDESHGKVGSD